DVHHVMVADGGSVPLPGCRALELAPPTSPVDWSVGNRGIRAGMPLALQLLFKHHESLAADDELQLLLLLLRSRLPALRLRLGENRIRRLIHHPDRLIAMPVTITQSFSLQNKLFPGNRVFHIVFLGIPIYVVVCEKYLHDAMVNRLPPSSLRIKPPRCHAPIRRFHNFVRQPAIHSIAGHMLVVQPEVRNLFAIRHLLATHKLETHHSGYAIDGSAPGLPSR